MKNITRLMLLAFMLYLAACSEQTGSGGGEYPANHGAFTLRIAGAQTRTILPSVSVKDFKWYRLTFTDTETELEQVFDCRSGNLTVTLEAASYNLTVTAYTESEAMEADMPAAKGELPEPVTITAGQNIDSEVTLYALEEGTGIFSWNLFFPDDLEEAYMQITPKETTLAAYQAQFGSTEPIILHFIDDADFTSTSGEMELASGNYSVLFTMKKENAQPAFWRENLQVYQNLNSCFEYDFTGFNLVATAQDSSSHKIVINFVQITNDNEALPLQIPDYDITIPHTAGNSITFSIALYAQYSQVEWYLDGVYQFDDDSYTLNSADFTAADTGSHTLTVEVEKDSKWYNRTIEFQITDSSGNNGSYNGEIVFGGDGTAENPYLITNIAELMELANKVNGGSEQSVYYASAHYRLTKNISLTGYEWMPIGTDADRFLGNFDGGGKTISGLHLTGNYADQGVFGAIGRNALIQRLAVSGTISGGSNNGGIAGSSFGTVENCYSTVTINGGSYSGGIVGWNRTYSRITNCYSTGSISGEGYSGGITGYNSNTVTNCVSLVTSVNGVTSAGRISGTNTGSIGTNKALSDMLVNGSIIDFNEPRTHGTDVTPGTSLSLVFSGWNETIWQIPAGSLALEGKLPYLK